MIAIGQDARLASSRSKPNAAKIKALEDQLGLLDQRYSAEVQQSVTKATGVEGQAPRVSLQLRGPIGPSTGSKILQQAGVKGVTPQEMLEPALDTVVIDNKDKPNAEDTQFGGLDRYQQDTITKMVGNEVMMNRKMQAALDEEAMNLVP